MPIQYLLIVAMVLYVAVLPVAVFAGASGTIAGYVRDAETRMGIPGANLTVDGTNFGAMADRHGYYIIYNVPVGSYTVSASVIGYASMKLTAVIVKTDLTAPASFRLSSRVLEAPERVEIAVPRLQIYRDVLSSTYYFGEEAITKTTPATTFYDMLHLVPGYVSNHFRAGRNTGIQYLVDGLPATGSFSRDMAFMVPNSAIAEMVVQTGGFSAEYGNVTSGVVNLVTKDGRNDFVGTLSLAKELPLEKDENYDNSSRAEFALSGPLKFGFGGPLIDANYLVYGSAYFNDTPFRPELTNSFQSPLFFNYDFGTKLMVSVSNDLFLRGQVLMSNWEWHRYDSKWSGKESALPKRLNRNLRFDLSMTHTVSPQMYYQIELSRLNLQREVFGEVLQEVESTFRLTADETLPTVWPGNKEPWREDLQDERWYGRLSLVRQLNPANQLKLGFEANLWQLAFERSRYFLWPDGSQSQGDYVYTLYEDRFVEQPYQVAAFVHHKIELEQFIATLGLRYELFSPNSEPINLQDNPDASGANDTGKRRYKHTLAPRLGIAIPVGNIEHLAINYGWFYELPSFYYLYLNKNGEVSAYWPMLGNVDLEPIRAKAWEVTYRRAISDRSVFSLTGFYREYDRLVDTRTFGDNGELDVYNENPTAFRYENKAAATVGGLELAYRRQFGSYFNGGLTYSYVNGSGTASWPESSFLSASRNERTLATLDSELAWNQLHSVSFNLAFQSSTGHIVSLLAKFEGPATSIDWLSSGSTELGWREFVDLNLKIPTRWLGFSLTPFLEVRNLLDRKSIDPDPSGIDFSNPSLRFESYYGRRVTIGILLQ